MQFDLNHYVAVSYKVHCFICLPKSVSPNQSAVIVLPLLHISESSNIDMNHLYCKRGSHLLRVGLKAWEALSLTFRGNDKITVQYNVTMSIQKKKKGQFNLCFCRYHQWLLWVKNAIFTMGRDVSKQKCKATRSRWVEKFYITLRCHTSLDLGCTGIMFCG